MSDNNGWQIYDKIPGGWWIDENSGSPIANHVFIINGSPLKGGKRALLRLANNEPTKHDYTAAESPTKPLKAQAEQMHKDAPKQLNKLARAKMQERLLKDIRADLIVCELEGWDKAEYLGELSKLINQFKRGEP